MRNIIILMQNNLRMTILKKPVGFLIYTLVPVVILLVASKVLTYGQSYINVGVVNEDKTKSATLVIDSINNNEGIQIKNINKESVNDMFIDKDINVSVEIPKGFEQSLLNGSNPQLKIKYLEDENLYTAIESSLDIQIRNMKDLALVSNGDYNKYETMLDKYEIQDVKIEKVSLNDLRENYELYRIFLGFLMMSMFFKASSGAHIVNIDKSRNIYTRMFVAPVKTYEYYLANILSNVICLMIQVSVAIIGLKYITKIEIGMEYYELFIILSVVSLVAVSIGNMCIAITKDVSEANMICNIVVMLFIMLGGTFISIQLLPDFMEKLSYFTPVRWAMMAITDLQQGLPFEHVIKYLGVMILFAATFFVVTAYKTSRDEKEFNILG